jgi:hypothetical protein
VRTDAAVLMEFLKDTTKSAEVQMADAFGGLRLRPWHSEPPCAYRFGRAIAEALPTRIVTDVPMNVCQVKSIDVPNTT